MHLLALDEFCGDRSMTAQLDRIEWKLDMLLATLRGGGEGLVAAAMRPPPLAQEEAEVASLKSADREVVDAMKGMSMKQHAALQMVVRGASNQEIADRFGVSVNTAKVYLRSVAKRLGVTLRTQVAAKVVPVLRALSDDDYRVLARGLPKNWDAEYAFARKEEDPYWTSYTGSRVKGEDDLDMDEGE
jgi:DNA-binding CsgD family transcriptional regulator